jgi:hypothetical protein
MLGLQAVWSALNSGSAGDAFAGKFDFNVSDDAIADSCHLEANADWYLAYLAADGKRTRERVSR